jgi:hypothetical protein
VHQTREPGAAFLFSPTAEQYGSVGLVGLLSLGMAPVNLDSVFLGEDGDR